LTLRINLEWFEREVLATPWRVSAASEVLSTFSPLCAGRSLSGQLSHRHLFLAKTLGLIAATCCPRVKVASCDRSLPCFHPPTCSARGFLPSRAGPARARASMRPSEVTPKKKASYCARFLRMHTLRHGTILPSRRRTRLTPRKWTGWQQYLARGLPCERFSPREQNFVHHSRSVGWLIRLSGALALGKSARCARSDGSAACAAAWVSQAGPP
jgi:hypothetical protein